MRDEDEDDMLAVPSDRYVVIPHVGVVNVGSIDAHDMIATEALNNSGNNSSAVFSGVQKPSTAAIAGPRYDLRESRGSRAAPPTQKKPKRRKPTLYELYHEGSSSDDSLDDDDDADFLDEAATMYTATASVADTSGSSNNNNSKLYEFVAFEVGMDINILLNQVHQNLLRSICLDDTDGTNQFLDSELICLAAALKHNRSVLSLQLRFLPVTDLSLVPLLQSLEQHPSLRALDLSGTKGTRKTGEALRRLACRNTNLLHVLRDETMYQEKDIAVLDEALQFNAMMCADPRSNPYDVKMISKVTEEERTKRLLEAQLNYNPWMQGPPPGMLTTAQAGNNSKVGRKKVVSFDNPNDNMDDGKDSLLSQRVCGDYIRGACRYGSRCKYYHPPWTSALGQVAQLQKYNEEEEQKRKWEAALRGSGSSSAAGSTFAPSQAAPPSEAASAHPSDARSLRWEDSSFIGNTTISVARSMSGNSTVGASSSKRRVREPVFTLDSRKMMTHTTANRSDVKPQGDDDGIQQARRQAEMQRRRHQQKRKRLLILSTAICCACTSIIVLASSKRGASQ